MILVTETPNGEHWNVVPASWMAYGQNDNPDNSSHGDWWGVDVSHWSPGEGPLHVRLKALSITPVCWMRYPVRESLAKLNRRAAQIYAKDTQP